jgi:hypothetical protein
MLLQCQVLRKIMPKMHKLKFTEYLHCLEEAADISESTKKCRYETLKSGGAKTILSSDEEIEHFMKFQFEDQTPMDKFWIKHAGCPDPDGQWGMDFWEDHSKFFAVFAASNEFHHEPQGEDGAWTDAQIDKYISDPIKWTADDRTSDIIIKYGHPHPNSDEFGAHTWEENSKFHKLCCPSSAIYDECDL